MTGPRARMRSQRRGLPRCPDQGRATTRAAPTPRGGPWWLGAVYGFALTIAFMAFSYTGDTAPAAVAALDLALACFGAPCGAALATVAALCRRRALSSRRW